MDAKEFIALLNDPEKVQACSVEELKELSLKYPYSQPLQLLYAIRLSKSSEYLFNRQLGKTSILTDDRSVLFDLFERPQEPQPGYSLPETEEKPAEEVAGPAENERPVREAPGKHEGEEEKPDYLQVVSQEEDAGEKDTDAAEVTVSEAVEEQAEEKEEKAPESTRPLHARDRIKAILEENRKLRGEFESARKEEKKELSAIEQRLEDIKKKLEQNRQNRQEEQATQQEPVELEAPAGEDLITAENQLKEEVEAHLDEIKEQVETEPQATAVEAAEAEVEVGPETDLPEGEAPEEPPMEEAELPVETPELLPEPEEAGEDTETLEETSVAEEPVEEPEEQSSISAPAHPASEKHSFSEWLKITRAEHARVPTTEPEAEKSPEPETKPAGFEKKIELLDTFVEKLPELKKKKPAPARVEKPAPRVQDYHSGADDSLVTETLARVYIEQKHYEKAIKAYEIMKLKYPEKSGLFAARISEIKKLINSK